MFEYGVFIIQDNTHRWGRMTNKAIVLKIAKQYHGIVKRMRLSSSAWDAPTYRICADIIADYRSPSEVL